MPTVGVPFSLGYQMGPGRIPYIPPEICQFIIDFFDEVTLPRGVYDWQSDYYKDYTKHKQGLVSLGLACHSWIPRTRFHIFRTVILDSLSRIERFIRTLSDFPKYGAFVESLEIAGNPEQEELSSRWIHRALVALPPLLSSLHTLTFHNLPILHSSYLMLCSRFNSVRSLIIDHLTHQSLGEVIQLVNRFPHLHKLTLGANFHLRRSTRCHVKIKRDLTTLSLRSHVYHNLSNQAVFSQKYEDFSNKYPMPELTSILRSCSQTIQTLYLPIPDVTGDV